MTPKVRAARWRQRRAVILRHRGDTYVAIAAHLRVSRERARQIVFRGAQMMLPPELRHALTRRECLRRVLRILAIGDFNRAIARRARARTDAADEATP